MKLLRDVSIKRKLTLITMTTTTVTLLLAGAAYLTYDLITFRQAMADDLSILAEIIGTNSRGALAFSDQQAGGATLESLRAERHIVSACLSGKDGALFATYLRDGSATRADDNCLSRGRGNRRNRLEVSRAIVFDGDVLGTIEITSDLQEFYDRLKRYASIALGVALVSSLLGWLLATQLQRLLSEPILGLVATARTVSSQMDYSVRAVKQNEDEIGLLIDGFNQMLSQIEKRDAALTALSNQLNQLYQLSTAMQAPLSLREQLGRVLEAARRVADVDRFYIWALTPGDQHLVALVGAGFTDEEWKELEGAEIPLAEAGAMYKAYREGTTLVFDQANPLPDELKLKPPHSELNPIRTRTFAVLPMIAYGVTVGLCTADNKWRGQVFLPHTVDLLQIFASHAAIAIENARLFRDTEEKGQQLEIASKHKSQFLANMSHELRTPLNAILGYTELIADRVYGEVPPSILEVMERVQGSGRHLLGLINDVLDLSKIEAGQLILSIDDYSLADVIATVHSSVEPLATQKDLRLVVSVAPDLPVAHGDGRRISQVLLNLMGNAIKFTDAGEVRVEATEDGGLFRVSVSDTGPGIAANEQGKIFEEFHQADSTGTRKKGGTGLGLSIAKKIVELHGGSLGVTSTLGSGSVFTFTMPVRAVQRTAT